MTLEDQVEIRKAVWRAVRSHFERFGAALNLTPLLVNPKQAGLVVYSDLRSVYCDGRAHPQCVCTEVETKRSVVFLPLSDEPNEKDLPPTNTRIFAHV